MNYNVIYKNDNAYKIIEEISILNFLNSDNSINQRVLGLYVNKLNCDHVLQRENKFLICQTIQDAVIIEE
jgi:hypothetical protein